MSRFTGWGMGDLGQMEVEELKFWASEVAKFQKKLNTQPATPSNK